MAFRKLGLMPMSGDAFSFKKAFDLKMNLSQEGSM